MILQPGFFRPPVCAGPPSLSLLIPATSRLSAWWAASIPFLIHSYWSPVDREPPTWQRWLAAAQRRWREVPEFKDMQHLSFREELHAIEAVIAGQGIGIFSDVLVAPELAAGTLVKAFKLSLPGYGFYVIRRSGHPRERTIRAFSEWLRSAT
ncbi:LysR substrate-binding domain-containing protein [Paraburkholderia aromaticivorans]|uniref:LysR substrate-binding domain-containing protein n=1 Tax=Paraburkholderia aromaticivorans TaxID=2026199 RepID=UPI00198204B7|nr:LysR substrate-binding domain-containing protein [Paraburkholderia aromaticivorans]